MDCFAFSKILLRYLKFLFHLEFPYFCNTSCMFWPISIFLSRSWEPLFKFNIFSILSIPRGNPVNLSSAKTITKCKRKWETAQHCKKEGVPCWGGACWLWSQTPERSQDDGACDDVIMAFLAWSVCEDSETRLAPFQGSWPARALLCVATLAAPTINKARLGRSADREKPQYSFFSQIIAFPVCHVTVSWQRQRAIAAFQRKPQHVFIISRLKRLRIHKIKPLTQ